MAVGVQADMASGLISTVRQQLLRLLHFLRAQLSFSRDLLLRRRAQRSRGLANGSSKAQPRQRRHPHLQRLRNAYSAARQHLLRVAHSRQWQSELRSVLLLSRLNRVLRRLLGSLKLALQRLVDHPRFQRLLDMCVLLLLLLLLFLLLLPAAVTSGSRWLGRQLRGLLSQVRAIPGLVKLVRAIPGRGRRPRQQPGQNKPTLRPSGRKQHEE